MGLMMSSQVEHCPADMSVDIRIYLRSAFDRHFLIYNVMYACFCHGYVLFAFLLCISQDLYTVLKSALWPKHATSNTEALKGQPHYHPKTILQNCEKCRAQSTQHP